MPRPIHFEIHASDPQKVIAFYTGLFGWTFTKWSGPWDYWLITTGSNDKPGINGGLLRRPTPPPTMDHPVVIAYVCTMDVSSLDESMQRGLALGGIVALPKMQIPGIGWLAYLKDPDGNVFGLMQHDVPAA